MSLFRKEEEDEEYFEDEEREVVRRHRSRQFRDLIPRNKRLRKEPPKPWGKKERLLVLAVLLLTIIASGMLAFSVRDWKLPGLPRLKIPSINFLKEDTIIIEKDKGREKENSEKVISQFKEATKNLSGVYGLYVVNLSTGFSYGVYEDESFEPASLNKLPVILGLFMEAQKGNLDLETKYSLKASDKTPGSGSLYGKATGTVLTYRDIARYMGKESDNTAVNIARNILGKEKIEGIVKEIGMTETNVLGDDQYTTPYDVGILFEKLWQARLPAPEPARKDNVSGGRSDGGQGEIVSKESADEILGFMTDTIYENWLAAGLPSGTKVAHKFGRELHVVNDAGIVFTSSPYVVVIMSKGVVEREADEIFPTLSKIVYEGQSG